MRDVDESLEYIMVQDNKYTNREEIELEKPLSVDDKHLDTTQNDLNFTPQPKRAENNCYNTDNL